MLKQAFCRHYLRHILAGMDYRYSRKTTDGGAAVLAAALVFALLISRRHKLETMLSAALITAAILLLSVGTGVLVRIHSAKKAVLRPSSWDKMNGLQFEDQIVIWLKTQGYSEVQKTQYYDQGIDILAAKPGEVVGVQVKRSAKAVGVAAIRAAVAGLAAYGCSRAMVVTNSSFTAAAIRLARANNCELINGERLKADSLS